MFTLGALCVLRCCEARSGDGTTLAATSENWFYDVNSRRGTSLSTSLLGRLLLVAGRQDQR